MFCPKCGILLNEASLIKKNLRYAPGNVPIEYDARCPNCSVEMGRVFWGKLTVHPDLADSKFAHETESTERTLIPPPPEPRTTRRTNAKAAQEAESEPEQQQEPPIQQKLCPHCGMPLPEDY